MHPDSCLMNKINNLPASPFLLTVLVLFIVSRLGYLNLPFYWDEAWSYGTAIFDMAGKDLAILPGDANPDLTRGHPLLFYFLSALWVKIFGANLAMVHIFPLLISTSFLVAAFILARSLFGNFVAMAAVLLLSLQSVFLAQSTQLLPEVMLALWTLLSAYAYFTKKWALFVLFSSLLILTKETGMVFLVTLFLDKIVLERYFADSHKESGYPLLRELAFMIIPVVIFVASLVIQKVRSGYYLYPEHLKLAITEPHEVVHRFLLFLYTLLFQHGRFVFFAISSIAFISLSCKSSVSRHSMHWLIFSALFITCYLAFASVNFFTTRYLLSVFPFFFIPGSWLITEFIRTKWLITTSFAALITLFSWCALKCNRNEQDTSLGYKNTVLLQKQAINHIEEMDCQNKPIYATFLMQYYMSIPKLGYLHHRDKPFLHVSNHTGITNDVYIFCSNEPDPIHAVISINKAYFLNERLESKGAWVEIYQKKNLTFDRVTK